MGKARPTHHRVDTAFALVQKQRVVVDATTIGSPEHRRASEVLALMEESHFLLSEMDRMAASSAAVGPPIVSGAASQPTRARTIRVPLGLIVAFAAALVAAAIFLEVVDPAPIDLQASELKSAPTLP